MERPQPIITHTNMQMATSTCSMCGGENSSSTSAQPTNNRKGHKRRKNCPGKCQRMRQDEPHWSKLLQTCQVPSLSSPPPATSPPVSPMAAFGQSVSRFFKWITPNRKTTRRNSLEESDRPTSVSSEDSSVYPDSPTPKTFSTVSSSGQPLAKSVLIARPVVVVQAVDKTHTLLQTPSSSALLTKRLHEKLHRVQKPTPIAPRNITKNGKITLSIITGDPNMLKPGNTRTTSPGVSYPGKLATTTQTLPSPSLQGGSSGHSPLAVASSCPLEQKKLFVSESSRTNLADTWPLCNHHLTYDEEPEDVFEDGDNHSRNNRKNVQEFTISHENTHKDELIGSWKLGSVYKGRWHGDVMIQTYDAQGDDVTKEFWEEVNRMSRIRHENIALFMGACTTTGHLSLITSVCNGMSLYEKLHILSERITLPIKINLAYQVAQALAYLHAKKIVYKNMTSKNIFIEKQKATLSVINFSNIRKPRDKNDGISGQLPYLAPELLTYLVSSINSDPSIPYTPQTDIYAFGVFLYELISGTRPYRSIPKDALILQVSNGRRPVTEKLTCPQTLKTLMESCWAHLPHHRSHTHEILKGLQKKDVALHNRFSSSEPDSINKLKSANIF